MGDSGPTKSPEQILGKTDEELVSLGHDGLLKWVAQRAKHTKKDKAGLKLIIDKYVDIAAVLPWDTVKDNALICQCDDDQLQESITVATGISNREELHCYLFYTYTSRANILTRYNPAQLAKIKEALFKPLKTMLHKEREQARAPKEAGDTTAPQPSAGTKQSHPFEPDRSGMEILVPETQPAPAPTEQESQVAGGTQVEETQQSNEELLSKTVTAFIEKMNEADSDSDVVKITKDAVYFLQKCGLPVPDHDLLRLLKCYVSRRENLRIVTRYAMTPNQNFYNDLASQVVKLKNVTSFEEIDQAWRFDPTYNSKTGLKLDSAQKQCFAGQLMIQVRKFLIDVAPVEAGREAPVSDKTSKPDREAPAADKPAAPAADKLAAPAADKPGKAAHEAPVAAKTSQGAASAVTQTGKAAACNGLDLSDCLWNLEKAVATNGEENRLVKWYLAKFKTVKNMQDVRKIWFHFIDLYVSSIASVSCSSIIQIFFFYFRFATKIKNSEVSSRECTSTIDESGYVWSLQSDIFKQTSLEDIHEEWFGDKVQAPILTVAKDGLQKIAGIMTDMLGFRRAQAHNLDFIYMQKGQVLDPKDIYQMARISMYFVQQIKASKSLPELGKVFKSFGDFTLQHQEDIERQHMRGILSVYIKTGLVMTLPADHESDAVTYSAEKFDKLERRIGRLKDSCTFMDIHNTLLVPQASTEPIYYKWGPKCNVENLIGCLDNKIWAIKKKAEGSDWDEPDVNFSKETGAAALEPSPAAFSSKGKNRKRRVRAVQDEEEDKAEEPAPVTIPMESAEDEDEEHAPVEKRDKKIKASDVGPAPPSAPRKQATAPRMPGESEEDKARKDALRREFRQRAEKGREFLRGLGIKFYQT